MVSIIHTSALVGMQTYPVVCEVDFLAQLPAFHLVGLPSSLTQESKERVRSAVINSNFEWPARKITVNLLPATLPKWGSHFELAMALGILLNSLDLEQQLEQLVLHRKQIEVFAIGELSLSGIVHPLGWLPLTSDFLFQFLQKRNALVVAHPKDLAELFELEEFNAARKILQQKVIAAEDLGSAIGQLKNKIENALEPSAFEKEVESVLYAPNHLSKCPAVVSKNSVEALSLLKQVQKEPIGVLAALTAIVGKHHLLACGPHGMGKSMLLKAICQSLSPLSGSEMAQRKAFLKSGIGFFESSSTQAKNRRPVVALQTSVSRAALEGSLLRTGQVMAGQMSAAHLGVLVADEFLEYRRDVLESLRQPLEEGKVRLQRAEIRTILPAQFQLLASTNLCPCGYRGHPRKACRCIKIKRDAYYSKLSGPLIDRFDLVFIVGLGTRPIEALTEKEPELKNKIEYLLDSKNWNSIVELQKSMQFKKVELPSDEAEIQKITATDLSHRSISKVLKIAKTLSIMLGDESLEKHHISLAMFLRQDLGETMGRVN